MIPALEGEKLPLGVWDCTLVEIEIVFGGTARRRELIARLRNFLASHATLPRCPIYIDGSFVTAKETPGDLDLCVDLTMLNETQAAPWERIFFAEKWYLEKEGIDYWFKSKRFPEDLIRYFQGVDAITSKGILRLP